MRYHLLLLSSLPVLVWAAGTPADSILIDMPGLPLDSSRETETSAFDSSGGWGRLTSYEIPAHLISQFMTPRDKSPLMLAHFTRKSHILASIRPWRSAGSLKETVEELVTFNEPEFEALCTALNVFLLNSANYRKSRAYVDAMIGFESITEAFLRAPPLFKFLPAYHRYRYAHYFSPLPKTCYLRYLCLKLRREISDDIEAYDVADGRGLDVTSMSPHLDVIGRSAPLFFYELSTGNFAKSRYHLFLIPSARVVVCEDYLRSELMVYHADAMHAMRCPFKRGRWRLSRDGSHLVIQAVRRSSLRTGFRIILVPLYFRNKKMVKTGGSSDWHTARDLTYPRSNRLACIGLSALCSSLVLLVVALTYLK
jgi:hypothetical protein